MRSASSYNEMNILRYLRLTSTASVLTNDSTTRQEIAVSHLASSYCNMSLYTEKNESIFELLIKSSKYVVSG